MRLTIEIPDKLAEQLEPQRERVAEVIARGLRGSWSCNSPLRREVIDFLARQPTAEEIIGFRPMEASERRIQELLTRNRVNTLTQEEEAELDEMCEVDRFISLLKTQVLLKASPGT
jgi:hypothetical protein